MKVTAFVTRGDGAERELLVFCHPSAGVQVPAGTVEIGEAIEAAVLREVKEEAGLTEVEIVAKLATMAQPMAPNERVLLRPVRLRTEPRSGAPLISFALYRGTPVRVAETHGPFARVAYEEYDLRSVEPSLIRREEGWVPSDALTSHVTRHLFHLRATAPTPERWTVRAEGRYNFQLYWVTLMPRPDLVRGQDVWLDRVYDRLRT